MQIYGRVCELYDMYNVCIYTCVHVPVIKVNMCSEWTCLCSYMYVKRTYTRQAMLKRLINMQVYNCTRTCTCTYM